jgi:hypothetical protein
MSDLMSPFEADAIAQVVAQVDDPRRRRQLPPFAPTVVEKNPGMFQGEIRNSPQRPQDWHQPIAQDLNPGNVPVALYEAGKGAGGIMRDIGARQMPKGDDMVNLAGIFIGPRGVKNLEGSTGRAPTGTTASLARAQEMHAQGAPRADIWRDTFWTPPDTWRGADQGFTSPLLAQRYGMHNQWATELPTNELTWGGGSTGQLSGEIRKRVPETQQKRDLLEAVPELDGHISAMSEVQPDPKQVLNVGTNRYGGSTNRLGHGLNASVLNVWAREPTAEQLNTTGWHETQHVVQNYERAPFIDSEALNRPKLKAPSHNVIAQQYSENEASIAVRMKELGLAQDESWKLARDPLGAQLLRRKGELSDRYSNATFIPYFDSEHERGARDAGARSGWDIDKMRANPPGNREQVYGSQNSYLTKNGDKLVPFAEDLGFDSHYLDPTFRPE